MVELHKPTWNDLATHFIMRLKGVLNFLGKKKKKQKTKQAFTIKSQVNFSTKYLVNKINRSVISESYHMAREVPYSSK